MTWHEVEIKVNDYLRWDLMSEVTEDGIQMD